jgi:WD40 repeat protein
MSHFNAHADHNRLLEDINCSDAWLLLSKPSTAPEEIMNDEEFLNAIAPLQPESYNALVDSVNLEETSLYINGDGKSEQSQNQPQVAPQQQPRKAPQQQQVTTSQPPQQQSITSSSPLVEEKSDNTLETDEEKMSKELIEKYRIKPNDLDKLMVKAGSGRSSKQQRKSVSWSFGEEDAETDGKIDEASETSRSFGAETNKVLEQLNKVKVSTPTSLTRNESTATTAVVSHHRAWKPKYVLGNHLDAVRSVAFHDREPLLLSGSEDRTVKLWNVSKPSKRSNEPIHTFRGHTGPVFVVRCQNDFCFSAGADASVRVWDTPNTDNNPYASHGHAEPFSRAVIQGHTDAIWAMSLSSNSSSPHILSASSDGTTRLWNYRQIVSENDNVDELHRGIRPVTPKHTIYSREGATPTCVTHLPNDPSKFIVSFTDSTLSLFDIESQQVLWTTIQPQSNIENNIIYQCIAHPTLPMVVTAHEDSNIRFFDTKTGQMSFEMVGHKDAVSCLAFDPTGLYFMSGGHDSSLRVWDVQTKHCVQEIPTHRKKYDESIHSLAYHPTKSMVASAGADSIIKLFQ